MQPLRVETVSSLGELQAMEGHLGALSAAAGAGAYDRPGFFLPWARAAVAVGQQPACLCLWRGQELAGFVPLFRRRDWKAALAWRGGPPVFGSSPAFDFLTDPQENQDELAGALIRALERMRWLDLTFENLPEGNRLGRWLGQAFVRQGYSVGRSPGLGYFLAEGVSSSAELEAQLSSKNRRNLRAAERKMAASCEVSLFTQDDDPEAAVQVLHAVVAASWKDCPRMRRIGLKLYADQIRGCARDGTLRFWSVSCQGNPAAFIFNLAEYGGTHHGYFTAITPKGCELGAGTALMYRSLKHSLDEGAASFNLWSARHNIKRMTNSRMQTVSLRISRASLGARLRLEAASRLQLLRQAFRTGKSRPRTQE
ncbi:GNAT family N-acetyltransferase [Leisingera daeponensis]|uniref:GNAT family N-acetyltransferase n=1 Tax=Leisingera daeponensis TaxID=405746 RepID=UPI001C95963B|nr:GNAT family N-acetyltransferase [Leisingera daeponensis]MBY6058091.1 GNAT family N-acetyltransferase [Leisingera daeponensis]